MQPSASTPLTATDDAFKASRLERMLSNFTASYKLYFLKAVFDEAVDGTEFIPYDLLAAKMVAAAWYPVLFFRLNLGVADRLAEVVDLAYARCDLSRSATPEEVVGTLLESDDPQLAKGLSSLCKYVPYRLIRPFYNSQFDKQKRSSGSIKDALVNGLVLKFNNEDPSGAPYTLEYDGRGIVIDSGWAKYLRDNRLVIQGWLDMRLVSYLQARNPSVPAIPLKINPPLKRDLKDARRWWQEFIADHDVNDIYTGTSLNGPAFNTSDSLSIDHFVPWSFVLHDEPWNLIPTSCSANSSKGDRLPNLEQYFGSFCAIHLNALITLRARRQHRKIMESYALVDANVFDYEDSERSLAALTESLSRVIVPLHQIAANQGFPMWGGLSA